jgi:hypothetical protein
VRTTPLICQASVATRIRIRISSLLILNFRTFAQRCFRDMTPSMPVIAESRDHCELFRP